MKDKVYHVTATWDQEAKVWVSESDIPGLVIEAETLQEFEALMQELAPEVLADNHGREGKRSIELVSRRRFELEDA
ncbi:MAG TPA: DUF1902 domain-containing protein [Caulobacteraceae bacterium]|nr:DUF1902 domain-containing protein [Caulobacteraceae bacterium]